MEEAGCVLPSMETVADVEEETSCVQLLSTTIQPVLPLLDVP